MCPPRELYAPIIFVYIEPAFLDERVRAPRRFVSQSFINNFDEERITKSNYTKCELVMRLSLDKTELFCTRDLCNHLYDSVSVFHRFS